MELDDILKKVWQHRYHINLSAELKAELRSYFGEQIAREIEAEAKRSELIEESRYSEEYESSRIASFNGGHIGGLTTAAAIARGEG